MLENSSLVKTFMLVGQINPCALKNSLFLFVLLLFYNDLRKPFQVQTYVNAKKKKKEQATCK